MSTNSNQGGALEPSSESGSAPSAADGAVVGDQSAAAAVDRPYRSYGQYVPARLGGPSKFGYLTYHPAAGTAAARLEFISKDNERYFNVPVAEAHSLALADYNATLEFWQGDIRHRVCLLPRGLAQANFMAEFTGDTEAKHWFGFLAPLVGQAPEGLAVKAPMSKGKRVALNYSLGCLIGLIVVVVVLIVTIATSMG